MFLILMVAATVCIIKWSHGIEAGVKWMLNALVEGIEAVIVSIDYVRTCSKFHLKA